MLSIGLLRPGQHDYHRRDPSRYYARNGVADGHWGGAGAQALGLVGAATVEQLRQLFEGSSPIEGRNLVQNAGKPDRLAAYDLTFSAVKDVSLLYSLTPKNEQDAILDAHQRGVRAALGFIERDGLFIRTGKGGVKVDRADAIYVTYEHFLSRANEPALHTHALLLNTGVWEDGKTGALDGRHVLRMKMAAGALYRAETAYQLQRCLGIALARDESWYRIRNMPRSLVERFSSRRQAICEELARTGNSSAKAAAHANLATRQKKQAVDPVRLADEFRSVAESLGFTPDDAKRLCRGPRRSGPEPFCTGEVRRAVRELTLAEGHFTRTQLVREVAEAVQVRGVPASSILRDVDHMLDDPRRIVPLGLHRGEARYTTPGFLRMERQLLETAHQLTQKPSKHASDFQIGRAKIFSGKRLNAEQDAALRQVTQTDGRLHAVVGMAGVGKTRMLDAACRVWKSQGYEPIGLSLSGKAARGIEAATGMPSRTIDSFLLAERKALWRENSHGGRSKAPHGPRLTKRSVVVVDEAGMVDTRKMAELMRRVKKANGRIVLVGDPRQLQPIEAGNPYQAIVTQIVAPAQLKTIVRQQGWAMQAVRDMAEGDADLVLKAFESRGLLDVRETRKEAIGAMVTSWREQGGAARPKSHLMLASTLAEVDTLNRAAQSQRRESGKLGVLSVKCNGQTIYAGDRILVTENSLRHRVRNGDLGTVLLVEPVTKNLVVHLDAGGLVALPLHVFPNVELGYAVTTHKAQGITVDQSYVLLGGPMQDREMSYVQVSRAAAETRLFTDKIEAGENLADLVRQMSTSRQKIMAQEIQRRNDREAAVNLPEPNAPLHEPDREMSL